MKAGIRFAAMALVAGGAAMEREARSILRASQGHPTIFNLGHGVHPPTDPDVLTAVAARVHERTAR